MNRRHRRALCACAAASTAMLAGAANAATASVLVQTQQVGTVDPGCSSETATCAADAAFSPSFGGYRAGGQVGWTMDIDRTAFASVTSLDLTVLVVGMRSSGNMTGAAGLQGNYLMVDGAPFAVFTAMTDGRDARTFSLPTTLTPGPHAFAVVAYGASAGALYEGWAGVDFATLTVTGQPIAVPEPPAAVLLACGGLVLASAAAKRRAGFAVKPSGQEVA